jgi:hypothetical protein
MEKKSTDAPGRILARGAIEQCSEVVDQIDHFENLGDERFLCGLTEFKSLLELVASFQTDISLHGGFFNLWTCACYGRYGTKGHGLPGVLTKGGVGASAVYWASDIRRPKNVRVVHLPTWKGQNWR